MPTKTENIGGKPLAHAVVLDGTIQQVGAWTRELYGVVLQAGPDQDGNDNVNNVSVLSNNFDENALQIGAILTPGSSLPLDIASVNHLYVQGTSGDIVWVMAVAR